MSSLVDKSSSSEVDHVGTSELSPQALEAHICVDKKDEGVHEFSNYMPEKQPVHGSTAAVPTSHDTAARQAPMFHGRRPSHTSDIPAATGVSSSEDESTQSKEPVRTTPSKDKPAPQPVAVPSSSHTIYPNTQDNSFKMQSPLVNTRRPSHTDEIPVDVGPKVVPSEPHVDAADVVVETDATPAATPAPHTANKGNTLSSIMSNLLHGRRPSHTADIPVSTGTVTTSPEEGPSGSHVEAAHVSKE